MKPPHHISAGIRQVVACGIVGLLALVPLWGPGSHATTGHTSRGGPPAVGALLRTVAVAPAPLALVADAPTERVFVFSSSAHDSRVTVLEARTGRVVGARDLGPEAYVPTSDGQPVAAVDARTGRVFVPTSRQSAATGAPSGPGRLWVLDGRTGAVRAVRAVGVAPQAVALDAGTRHLFVLDGDTTLRIIDAAAGRPLRTVPRIGGSAVAADSATGRLFVANGPEVDVLTTAAGAVRRRVSVTNSQVQEDALALAVDASGGRVVVGLTDATGLPDGRVLDARTGAVLYGSRALSTPLAVDMATDRIVAVATPLSSSGGDITAAILVGRTGRVLRAPVLDRTTSEGGTAVDAVDARTRHAIVVTSHSSAIADLVSVLDTHSGRLVRQFTLGAGPPAVAVDEQTGRVFVANAGDDTVSMLDATRL